MVVCPSVGTTLRPRYFDTIGRLCRKYVGISTLKIYDFGPRDTMRFGISATPRPWPPSPSHEIIWCTSFLYGCIKDNCSSFYLNSLSNLYNKAVFHVASSRYISPMHPSSILMVVVPPPSTPTDDGRRVSGRYRWLQLHPRRESI